MRSGEGQCPSRIVLAVEHPGHVRNVDKAITGLGGTEVLKRKAEDPLASTSVLELRFRPQDRFEHPIESDTTRTNNILIKVQDTILEDGSHILQQSPVAMIRHTVRFRSLSDFQWNTSQSEFLNRLQKVTTTRDAQIMSNFALSREVQSTGEPLDMMPPPRFSNVLIPQNYNYRQNPAAKKVQTDTGLKLVNRSRGARQHLQSRVWDDDTVPDSKSSKLPDNPDPDLLPLISQLQELFKQRPMWTRRALVNTLQLEGKHNYSIKFAIPYVAYIWRSGPWRDCYAPFGLDPRRDQKYALYQAIYCTTKGFTNVPTQDDNLSESHVFDGKTLFPACRTYMLTDISDPILVQIRDSAVKRREFHPRDGWWRSRTIQALRQIIKGKMTILCSGMIPSDLEFTAVLRQVNEPDDDDEKQPEIGTHLSSGSSSEHEDEFEDYFADLPRGTTNDTRLEALRSNLVEPGAEFDVSFGARPSHQESESSEDDAKEVVGRTSVDSD